MFGWLTRRSVLEANLRAELQDVNVVLADATAEIGRSHAEIDRLLNERASQTIAKDRDAARADADRYKADALSSAELVAKMHAAALGEVRSPIRGVVEDVQDIRTCWLNAEARVKELEELPETIAAIREQNADDAATAEATGLTVEQVRAYRAYPQRYILPADDAAYPPEMVARWDEALTAGPGRVWILDRAGETTPADAVDAEVTS